MNNGYQYFFDKNHPLAHKDGKVLYHRHMASLKIGRWLTNEEIVHHIDGNRVNNDVNNIQVLESQREHTIIENKIRGNTIHTISNCKDCSKELKMYDRNKSGLCGNCCRKSRRIFDPEKEALQKLVWSMPTIKVAEIFNVTDKAIDKRCKLFGIEKPPRGYWQKIKARKILEI